MLWTTRKHEPTDAYELVPSNEIIQLHPANKPRRWGSLLLFGTVFFAFATGVLITIDILFFASPRRTKEYGAFISKLWPTESDDRTDDWENENSKSMRILMECIVNGNCNKNQTNVILLSSFHFSNTIAGSVSGEDIWAMSVLLAIKELGYTPIYAPRNYELARTYRQFPELVKAIILEGDDAKKCFDDLKCIKSRNHPLGIPAWKMFSFHYWGGASHPLGNPWTLSPENYSLIYPGTSKDNFYLGYSIERTCSEFPFLDLKERPNQAYVYAKRLAYFHHKEYAWPNVSFVPPYPLSIVSGVRDDSNFPSGLPDGIRNLGVLNKTQFYEALGRSRVLIGIGSPFLGPSPYDALCMGVPFINPILGWNHEHPDDRVKWRTQHDGLKFENPPYVYNVRRDDEEGLWRAVQMALANPIDRYIVPRMTMNALKLRVGKLIETDWKSKAEALLEERIRIGKGKIFDI